MQAQRRGIAVERFIADWIRDADCSPAETSGATAIGQSRAPATATSAAHRQGAILLRMDDVDDGHTGSSDRVRKNLSLIRVERSLDQLVAFELEGHEPMRGEFLLVGWLLHVHVGTVQGDATRRVSGGCEAAPRAPGPARVIAIRRGFLDLLFPRFRNAAMAEAPPVQSPPRMLIIKNTLMLVPPIPGGNQFLFEQMRERFCSFGPCVSSRENGC